MFSITRFSEQFMILFRQNKNRHGLILAIFVGIQLFGLVNHFSGSGNHDTEGFYKTAIFFNIILCVMACQDVFNKLRSTPSGIQYLMTPATITEKYSAAWLYSSLFVFAVAQLTYVVLQIIGVSAGNLLTGLDSSYGLPNWKNVWDVFQTVMFAHGVFFFGSLLFRKNPIIKTLGAYIGIVFILTLCFAWFAKNYLFETQVLGSDNLHVNMDVSLGSSINGIPIQHFIELIGLNIKWILGSIVVLLWGGSYWLLYKKQI